MKKIRKWVNHLLYDKDAFHKNSGLRAKVELHAYLLERLIDVEKQIVPEKIRYFWENKKAFLLRLTLKGFGWLFFVIGVLFIAWFFGFRYNPPSVVKHQGVVLYVTDNADTNYIKSRIPKVKFIVLYPPDPRKDWKSFREAMHFRFETAGMSDSAAYKARRWEPKNGKKVPSQYWGKYQMGEEARHAVGDYSTWEQFSTNPERQEGDFLEWIRILYGDMSPYIARYSGRFIAGYQITASGIISMVHNVGMKPTISFLRSKGDTIPSDGDGVNTPKRPATRYLSLGGYDLTSILDP